MGGIEPPSNARTVRLLRVQLRKGVLLGSDLCPEHLGRRAQSQRKSRDALRRSIAASPLDDARVRGEGRPGLTDFRLA